MPLGDPRRHGSAERSAVQGLSISEYSLTDDAEALELDRRCAQGRAFRLSFRRETFRRRAENFRTWRILTARLNGILVGTVAGALKNAHLLGTPTRVAFIFDLRVHPSFRRRGIGKRLAGEMLDWAYAHARVAYTYVVADNRITRHLAGVLGGTQVGEYAYLVYPTYRQRASLPLEPEDFTVVHDSFLDVSPSFDFYCDPDCHVGEAGYVGSWLMRRGGELAGCSAWSNRGILGEVVERMPLSLRTAGWALGSWPLARLSWPHLPKCGEELRSWYVFDFFSTSPGLARELGRALETEALRHGIDYCYMVHRPGDSMVEAVRAEAIRFFAPTIDYRLLASTPDGEVPALDPIYVDIRDL